MYKAITQNKNAGATILDTNDNQRQPLMVAHVYSFLIALSPIPQPPVRKHSRMVATHNHRSGADVERGARLITGRLGKPLANQLAIHTTKQSQPSLDHRDDDALKPTGYLHT